MQLMDPSEYEKYQTYGLMRSVGLGVRVLLYVALVAALVLSAVFYFPNIPGVRVLLYVALVAALVLSAVFYFPNIPGAQAASAAIEATGGHLRYLGFALIIFTACISYFPAHRGARSSRPQTWLPKRHSQVAKRRRTLHLISETNPQRLCLPSIITGTSETLRVFLCPPPTTRTAHPPFFH